MTIVIGNEDETDLITGTVALPVTDYNIKLVDANNISAGVLVTEPSRVNLISGWGLGSYEFSVEDTEFCVTCCMPVPRPGVTAFRLENGDILSGKVWLLGGDGVVINAEEKLKKDGTVEPVIKINVVGDPLYLQKLCDPENLFNPVNAIREIKVTQDSEELHSCGPDDFGNFNIQMNDALTADPALRIRTTPDGILFNVEGDAN